jgi:THO complex subunit 2
LRKASNCSNCSCVRIGSFDTSAVSTLRRSLTASAVTSDWSRSELPLRTLTAAGRTNAACAQAPKFEDLLSVGIEVECIFHIIRPAFMPIVPEADRDKDKAKPTADAPDSAPLTASWEDKKLTGHAAAMLPASVWERISPELYMTFWSLSVSDVYVPVSTYSAMIDKCNDEILNPADTSHSSESVRKRQKDKERLLGEIAKLRAEQAWQQKNMAAVKKRLMQTKDQWLEKITNKLETVTELLQKCVIPRCVVSNVDALFCAKFVHLMHEMNTTGFSSLQYYDRTLKTVLPWTFCCSSDEAARLGVFMNETLLTLGHWQSSRAIYSAECDRVGFQTSFQATKDSKRCSYEEYLNVHLKWHKRLTRAVLSALDSREYMEIHNTVVMLSKCSQTFPTYKQLFKHVEAKVSSLQERPDLAELKDLKLLCLSYGTVLARRRPIVVGDEPVRVKKEVTDEPSKVSKTHEKVEDVIAAHMLPPKPKVSASVKVEDDGRKRKGEESSHAKDKGEEPLAKASKPLKTENGNVSSSAAPLEGNGKAETKSSHESKSRPKSTEKIEKAVSGASPSESKSSHEPKTHAERHERIEKGSKSEKERAEKVRSVSHVSAFIVAKSVK